MAVCEPSSLSAEGFTLKTIPLPSPSVLLNLQLKRCKLMLGSSQDSSKETGSYLANCCGCSCFGQHKGRETWVCSMGVPSSIRLPPAPGEFHWLRKRQHTKKGPEFTSRPFPFPFQFISTSKNQVSLFSIELRPFQNYNAYLSLNLYQWCLQTLSKNHVTLSFLSPSFLNIPSPLRTLNKHLGNGRQQKLKWLFGTSYPIEETQKTESCLACDPSGDSVNNPRREECR